MAERKEYAVIRFLNQNGYCHMVSDYVKGYSLMQCVKMEIPVTKKCLIQWMAELAYQMEQYSRCEREKAYGCMNPYAVIVTEEEKILLLDTADRESEDTVRRMRKKKVRTLFVRRNHVLSQRMDKEDDWYGFGKTMQFMREKIHLEERLTKREEWKLRRIENRCLEGKRAGIREWKDLQRELQRLIKEAKTGKKEERRCPVQKSLVVAILLIITGLLLYVRRFAGAEKDERMQAELKKTGEGTNEECLEEESRCDEAAMELGLIYLVDWKEYEQSCKYLEAAAKKSELAGNYLVIAQSLKKGETENRRKTEIERAVRDIEEGISEKKDSILYQIPVMWGYELLGTQEGAGEIVKLGEALNEERRWREEELNREISMKECMAAAYEKQGERGNAIDIYENLKEICPGDERREGIWMELERLYEEDGDAEKADTVCREAAEALPESAKLQIHRIRRMLKNQETDRADCARAVKETLERAPGLAESEEFKVLEEEYAIVVSGGEVLVGR